jgi:hypothetical protein
VIVTDVVVPALLDVDVLLLLVAALVIILLARTTAGIVTETMTARADVTGIAPVALTIGTASVTPRMIARIVTAGRTAPTVMTESLSTVLLLLTRISMSPSERPVRSAISAHNVVWACQAQTKVSALWLRLASFPAT